MSRPRTSNGLQFKETDINILLLGETGNGKSTFINAAYTYLKNDSLESAIHGRFSPLIPFSFTYTDSDYEEHIISSGESDENENVESAGQSCTRICRSFVFKFRDRVFRIIDTPGIGDTRGFHQDTRNLHMINNYVSKFTHLNAVCLVMKPTATRLTIQLRYCFIELLRNMKQSLRQHICFIFTNCRANFFRPAGAIKLLQELLKEYESKSNEIIILSQENSFTIDNEGFRGVAIAKRRLPIDDDMKECFRQSWAKTNSEYTRFIKYISNRHPSKVNLSIDLSDVEKLIRKLPRPIANVLTLIQENIAIIERYIQNGTRLRTETPRRIRQLVGMVEQFPYPQTVCGGDSCCRIVQKDKMKKMIFEKVCHSECFLFTSSRETIRDEKLCQCEIMNSETGSCKECGCSFRNHLNITYEYLIHTDTINVYGSLDTYLEKLRHELNYIRESVKQVDTFLLANKFQPIFPLVVEFLKFFIRIEKRYLRENDVAYGVLDEIEENIRIIKNTGNRFFDLRNKPQVHGEKHEVPEPVEMMQLLTELQSLPINGQTIREQLNSVGNFALSQTLNENIIELRENPSNAFFRAVFDFKS